MHLGDSSKPRICECAASLQVQGGDALQAVEGQQACVDEGDLPAAIQGQRPANKGLLLKYRSGLSLLSIRQNCPESQFDSHFS